MRGVIPVKLSGQLQSARLRHIGTRTILMASTGLIGTIVWFAWFGLAPPFLSRSGGFDAWLIGTVLLSAGAFQLLAVVAYRAVANRIDLRWLLMFGLGCFAVAVWLLSSMTHDWGWRELLIPQAFRSFGQQFGIVPVVTLTLGALAPERLFGSR